MNRLQWRKGFRESNESSCFALILRLIVGIKNTFIFSFNSRDNSKNVDIAYRKENSRETFYTIFILFWKRGDTCHYPIHSLLSHFTELVLSANLVNFRKYLFVFRHSNVISSWMRNVTGQCISDGRYTLHWIRKGILSGHPSSLSNNPAFNHLFMARKLVLHLERSKFYRAASHLQL